MAIIVFIAFLFVCAGVIVLGAVNATKAGYAACVLAVGAILLYGLALAGVFGGVR
jgi:hypothetical protein